LKKKTPQNEKEEEERKKEQIMKLKSLCGLSRSSALFSLDFPPTIPHFFFSLLKS